MKDKLFIVKVRNKITGKEKLISYILKAPQIFDFDVYEQIIRSKMHFWNEILYIEYFHNLI